MDESSVPDQFYWIQAVRARVILMPVRPRAIDFSFRVTEEAAAGKTAASWHFSFGTFWPAAGGKILRIGT